jgi:hypothetical protein
VEVARSLVYQIFIYLDLPFLSCNYLLQQIQTCQTIELREFISRLVSLSSLIDLIQTQSRAQEQGTQHYAECPSNYSRRWHCQSHTNQSSQPASNDDDRNTPYPADHPLAPDGSKDQWGGWGVNADEETAVAALLSGSDVSKPKVGGSSRDGKKK